MPHKLPNLPYAYEALELYIDTQTMQIHHDKHHQAYINKLNDALKDYPELVEKSVEDLLMSIDSVPEKIRLTVKNNGGGHFNHSLFWRVMKPGGGEPSGHLAQSLINKFGDFAKFKVEFSKISNNFFGSGWCWLVADSSDKLDIITLPNHDCPITIGLRPLLVLDLWEHAYYLKYQNRRVEYVEAWWNIINWPEVEKNFENVKNV